MPFDLHLIICTWDVVTELCSEAIFGNLGVFKSCHFWQLLFPKVAKNGNFAKEVLPFLATFMQCQIFFPILAFHKIAKIGKTCLLKVAKNGNFRCYYRFAIIGNICSSSKSSQMTTALPYIPSGSIGKDSLHI